MSAHTTGGALRDLAARVWRWLVPARRWAPGFVETPHDPPGARQPGIYEIGWSMGGTFLVGGLGYVVAMSATPARPTWSRYHLHGLQIDAWAASSESWYTAHMGFGDDAHERELDVFFHCEDGLVLGHDPSAALLIPRRGYKTVAFDYHRRRVVRGGVNEVHRALATGPEWTVGGALGLLLALWVVRRAARLPDRLDRAAWRQGARHEGNNAVVFDGERAPVSASALPEWYSGPVAVLMPDDRLGPGSRDTHSGGGCTFITGSLDTIDATLRDARDVALTRALAITLTAGAPLAASWWVGLL